MDWTEDKKAKECVSAAGGSQHWLKEAGQEYVSELASCYDENGTCVKCPRDTYNAVRAQYLEDNKATDE